MTDHPHLIHLPKIGDTALGYITVYENSYFKANRVYWTYFTPDNVERGNHAHKMLQQLIFAVSGSIEFEIEALDDTIQKFTLNKPNIGLYIPPYHWRKITFSHNAVLLCLASEEFKESDYIRNYQEFKSLSNDKK